MDPALRDKMDWFEFYKFCGATQDIVKYDTVGLFEYVLRGLPIIGQQIAQREHVQKMVCSAFVTAALEAGGLLRGINYTKMEPDDVTAMKIYSRAEQLYGKPGTIKRVNSV